MYPPNPYSWWQDWQFFSLQIEAPFIADCVGGIGFVSQCLKRNSVYETKIMNSKSQYRRNIFTDCLTKLESDTRQKYDQYHIEDKNILN